MTNAEAIRCLSVHSSTNGSGLCTDEQHYEAKQVAIQALEQELCDDAISREYLVEHIKACWTNGRPMYSPDLSELLSWIDDIPLVQPKPLECEDEYIKVPKKALKYRTAGMVAYNVEWLKNHFDIERTIICGAQQPCEVEAAKLQQAYNRGFEDCRQAVLDLVNADWKYEGLEVPINSISPVTPKPYLPDTNVGDLISREALKIY